MKPLALSLLLTSAALLPLHVHADTLAPAPETPAAAFQRLFAHTPGPVQPPVGGAPDVLTRVFNDALWSTPATAAAYASARQHTLERAQ